jgi:hypothetical protein
MERVRIHFLLSDHPRLVTSLYMTADFIAGLPHMQDGHSHTCKSRPLLTAKVPGNEQSTSHLYSSVRGTVQQIRALYEFISIPNIGEARQHSNRHLKPASARSRRGSLREEQVGESQEVAALYRELEAPGDRCPTQGFQKELEDALWNQPRVREADDDLRHQLASDFRR